MPVIRTEIFKDENGIEMQKDYYSNGMTIEHMANPPEPKETISNEELQLNRDEIMLDMALSLEEIKLNQEIQMTGGETV